MKKKPSELFEGKESSLYKTYQKAVADDFNTLKDNPKEMIEWAESEIKEYKKLIKLIKKHYEKRKFKSNP